MHGIRARVGLPSHDPSCWGPCLVLPASIAHTPTSPVLWSPLIDGPTESGPSLPLWGNRGAMVGPPNQSHSTCLVWPGASECDPEGLLLFDHLVDLHIMLSLL